MRVKIIILPALKSYGWWWWVHCDYNVSSAPFLSELRLWEWNLDIWAKKSRSRAWQLQFEHVVRSQWIELENRGWIIEVEHQFNYWIIHMKMTLITILNFACIYLYFTCWVMICIFILLKRTNVPPNRGNMC